MRKRSLIIGSVVFIFAMLISLAGCSMEGPEGPAGGVGSAGTAADNVLNGTVSPTVLRRYAERAAETGRPLVLDNVTIPTANGGGTIDFGSAKVELYGTLTTTGTVPLAIVGGDATIELKEGAALNFSDAAHYFIAQPAVTGRITRVGTNAGIISEVVSGDPAEYVGTGVIAVKDYTIGKPAFAKTGLTVLVYGTLTVNGSTDSLQPTAGLIKPVGTVDITANNTVALTDNTKVDISFATITTSQAAVEVTLPAVASTTVSVPSGRKITIKGAGTSFAGKVEGSGEVVFDGLLTTTTAGLVIDSNVFLNAGIKIVDSSLVTLGSTRRPSVTLKSGTAISDASGAVLTATNGDTTFTPTAFGATLAANDSGNKVTVAGQAININGELTLAAGGDLVANADINLILESKLVLTSTNTAKLTGTGKLIAGKTEITGATAGWTANSANITITALDENTSSITSTSGTFTAGNGAAIVQLNGVGNNLTIGGTTTIALLASSGGSITLTGAASDGGKLTLAANTAKITGGATNTPVSPVPISGATVGSKVAGNATGATGGTMAEITGDIDENTIVPSGNTNVIINGALVMN